MPLFESVNPKLLGALCAQDYIKRHGDYTEDNIQKVSIDFDVLSQHTAMFGRIKLDEEQKEAIAAGKIKQTIHANANEPVGIDALVSDIAHKE